MMCYLQYHLKMNKMLKPEHIFCDSGDVLKYSFAHELHLSPSWSFLHSHFPLAVHFVSFEPFFLHSHALTLK